VKKLILGTLLFLSCAPPLISQRTRIVGRNDIYEMPTTGIIASSGVPVSQWIHVSEGLPLPNRKVVIYSRSQGIISFASWEQHGSLNGAPFYDWDVDTAELCRCPVFVTHWLELPAPPL
jgi:hypothetical protein